MQNSDEKYIIKSMIPIDSSFDLKRQFPIPIQLHQSQTIYPFENALPTPLISVVSISTVEQRVKIQLSLWCEIKQIIDIAWTLILTQLCELGPIYSGLIMVGHLPNSAMMLSGIGLAKVFYNVTAYRIVWGSQTALFTLVNESSNNNKLLRIYAQRAFYISIIISMPLLVLQYFCGNILIAMGEPKELKYIMNVTCYILIPNIYFKCWLSILRRLAQSLNCMTFDLRKASMFISVVFAVLSYPLSYICVNTFDLGFMVVPIVINFYTLMNLCGTIFILWYSGYLKALNLFKPVSFRKIFKKTDIIFYLKKSGWGTLQSQFKWWIYEISLILAGFVQQKPQIAVSVIIITTNILSISAAVGGGLQHAICIVAGKYIGDGMKCSLKQCLKAAQIISFISAMIISVVLVIFHEKIPYIFTNNEEIVGVMSYIIYLLVIKQLFLIPSQSMCGMFRAIGRTDFSTKTLFCSYYLVSLPLLVILLFINGWDSSLSLSTITIFGTLAIGTCIGSIAMHLYFLFCINWESVLSAAQTRLVRHCSTTSLNNSSDAINYGSIQTPIPVGNINTPSNSKSYDRVQTYFDILQPNINNQSIPNQIVTFHMTNLHRTSSV